MADLADLGAVELAALFASRGACAREIVSAHLARIAAENPSINAITITLDASALAAADALDRAHETGAPLGPLAGVPFTVKEDLDCTGSATTHGVPALANALPHLDAPAVARLKAAGAIPIARTNTSELGLRLCTDNPLRGRTKNPRAPRVTAGGSSGGDAAAVASRMTPLGLGGDLGGSLRAPAHYCGVLALKPSLGCVAHASSLPPEDFGMSGQAMFSIGPLARSVADLRAALSAMKGRDLRDPRSLDLAPPPPDPKDERTAAIVTKIPGATLPPDFTRAIELAAKKLEAAGYAIEEATPPEIERVCEIWHKLVATDLAAVLPRVAPLLSSALVSHVERLIAAARLSEATNHRIHEERSRLQRAWIGFLDAHTVLVGPCMIEPPWPAGADLAAGGLELVARATRFVLPANALGFPAVSVPSAHDGGASAVQILADLFREDRALDAADILMHH